VLKACEKLGIAFLPWYPLGDGAALRNSKIKSLSKKLNATPAQVAIAWLLAKSPVMLPIPGTSSVAHLEENMRATSVRLNDEDMASL
jgi:pyridoxine 4-dehydrogenase